MSAVDRSRSTSATPRCRAPEQALRHHLLLVDLRCCRRVKRHHVWALYAFCRYADDIVDDLGPATPAARARRALGRLRRPASSPTSTPGAPTTRCSRRVVHTVRAFAIDPTAFAGSCARWRWTSRSTQLRDLGRSARLHGRLGGGDRRDDAAHPRAAVPRCPARTLATSGYAFQLTNFLRDVGEDLDRGRVVRARRRTSTGSAPTRGRRPVDAAWRRADALRDRALPRALPLRRPRHRACCRRRRRAASRTARHAVRPDPRRIEDAGLRRVPRPGARADRGARPPWLPAWRSRSGELHGRPRGAGLLAGAWLMCRVAHRTLPRPSPAVQDGPRSVIVPARDEEVALPRLLASLAAQATRRTRSSSSTTGPRTARPLVARQAGVSVLTGAPPPDGWVGKPWACHTGADAAGGSLLVFLDADTELGPAASTGFSPPMPALRARRAPVGATVPPDDPRLRAAFGVLQHRLDDGERRLPTRPSRRPTLHSGRASSSAARRIAGRGAMPQWPGRSSRTSTWLTPIAGSVNRSRAWPAAPRFRSACTPRASGSWSKAGRRTWPAACDSCRRCRCSARCCG